LPVQVIHIKMMVVDRAVTLILNHNLPRSAFTTNREFGLDHLRPLRPE
jgi:hypothetical protein